MENRIVWRGYNCYMSDEYDLSTALFYAIYGCIDLMYISHLKKEIDKNPKLKTDILFLSNYIYKNIVVLSSNFMNVISYNKQYKSTIILVDYNTYFRVLGVPEMDLISDLPIDKKIIYMITEDHPFLHLL